LEDGGVPSIPNNSASFQDGDLKFGENVVRCCFNKPAKKNSNRI
jgi:hypothetical protein